MKQENRIRNALIALYWAGHDDGRICEVSDDIAGHIIDPSWAKRRKRIINETLQKLGLPVDAKAQKSKKVAKPVNKKKP